MQLPLHIFCPVGQLHWPPPQVAAPVHAALPPHWQLPPALQPSPLAPHAKQGWPLAPQLAAFVGVMQIAPLQQPAHEPGPQLTVSRVLPLCPPNDAPIMVVPVPAASARPGVAPDIVAAPVFVEDHSAALVTSLVVESE